MNRWVGAVCVATLIGAMLPRGTPPKDSKALVVALKVIASFECDSESCEEKSYSAINKCTENLTGKITSEEADEAAICYLKGPGKRAASKGCGESQECLRLIHTYYPDCVESVYDSKKFWDKSKNKVLGEELSECILKKGGYSKRPRFT